MIPKKRKITLLVSLTREGGKKKIERVKKKNKVRITQGQKSEVVAKTKSGFAEEVQRC